MSYFQFSAEYVLLAGGNDLYQSEFIKHIKHLIGENMDRSVYLYSAQSREVYLSKFAYLQFCNAVYDTFQTVGNILTPIANLTAANAQIRGNYIAEYLSYRIKDTVTYKVFPDKKVICCAKTGAELAIFSRADGARVFSSIHKNMVLEEIDRMNYLIQNGIIGESDESVDVILRKMVDHYHKYTDPRLAQYRNTVRIIEKYIIREFCYFGRHHLEKFKKYCQKIFENLDNESTISDALSKTFIVESMVPDDIMKLASEERRIVARINLLSGETYPLPKYILQKTGLYRNDIPVLLANGDPIDIEKLPSENWVGSGTDYIKYRGIEY